MFNTNYTYRKKITEFWSCYSQGRKINKTGRKLKEYYKKLVAKKLRKHSKKIIKEDINEEL